MAKLIRNLDQTWRRGEQDMADFLQLIRNGASGQTSSWHFVTFQDIWHVELCPRGLIFTCSARISLALAARLKCYLSVTKFRDDGLEKTLHWRLISGANFLTKSWSPYRDIHRLSLERWLLLWNSLCFNNCIDFSRSGCGFLLTSVFSAKIVWPKRFRVDCPESIIY